MTGKKKTINKSFWVAKGMVSDSYHTPIRGMPPKTFLRIYEKRTGKLQTHREFDLHGNAVKDLDVGHCTHNKTDHSHSYKNGKRSKEQILTKQEKRILKKAKKKRRIFNESK